MQKYHNGQIIYWVTGHPTHGGARFHHEIQAARVVRYIRRDKNPKNDKYELEYLDPEFARNRIPWWMASQVHTFWFPTRKAVWEDIIQSEKIRRQDYLEKAKCATANLRQAKASMKRELAREHQDEK